MTPNWTQTLSAHLEVITGLRDAGPTLDAIASAVIGAFRADRRLYIAGNGGSAADAQHIAAEFVGRFRTERRALPAVALTTDTSALTAIGNDYGFDHVFTRQIEALVRAGDIVWLLSTSGNSPNIVAGAAAARDRGAMIVGFTGRTGGKLAAICTHVLRVPHDTSDRIQEGHLLAYHYICGAVEDAFR